MITAKHIAAYTYAVSLDVADWKAVHNLAKAYGIPFDAMLLGCLNKGIDVIGKQVTKSTSKQIDDSACDDIC